MRKESIFAVPEGVNAKVGVTGSGKGMTQYQKVRRINPTGEEDS
jgi:survival of motor neuron-related-splicing factor 30